jgi:superfamily II DNA or RNA helicase
MEPEEKGLNEENLVSRIDAADEVLDASLASIRRKRGRAVTEKIDRLRLFRKLLANIRLNAHVFEHTTVPLRINQLQALKDLIAFLEDEGHGDRVGYFVQPSGAGKTVLYGAIARLMDVRTLALVPRSNLLEQVKRDWVETLGMKEDDIGLAGGAHDELGRQFTIANYQTHLSRMRRDQRYRQAAQECELILCDEAHKSLGEVTGESVDQLDLELDRRMSRNDERTEATTFAHLSRYTSRRALKLGFTATPRLVKKSVQDRFKTLISQTSYSDLVRVGILAKFRVLQVPAHIYPDEVESEITLKQEARILSREDIYRKSVDALQRMREEVRERLLPLAFCSTIRECDKFQEVAKRGGLSCAIVTGREYRQKPKADHIGEAERKLLDGDIDVIASVDKLQVGWDFPPLNTILQLRATLSPAILIQEAGRASRVYAGKGGAYIIEPQWKRNRQIEQEFVRGGKIIKREDAVISRRVKTSKDIADVLEQVEPPEEGVTPFYWETTRETPKKSRKCKEDTAKPSAEQEHEEIVSKKLKFHKTPLTLAEAFHILGEEDVNVVCEGWRGERLRYGTVPSLDEQGLVKIGNEIGVGIATYARSKQMNHTTLWNAVKAAGLLPIGFALSRNSYIPVFRLKEVEELQTVKDHHSCEQLSRENGEVLMNGFPVIGLSAYARLHNLNFDELRKHVDSAGLKPVGHAFSSSGQRVQAYLKSAVEALPYVQLRSQLPKMDRETDQVSIHGKTGTGLLSFARLYGLAESTIREAVSDAGLRPLGQAIHYSQIIDVYEVRELNKLQVVRDRLTLPKVDPDTGEVQTKKEMGVSLATFARNHSPLAWSSLREAVEKAGLRHIGFALTSQGKKVKVYRKSEIMDLPYVRDLLQDRK